MRAYDIEMLTRPVDRADPQDKGWCFGLPPGLTPEQWPLDPNNGYPLVHGFTILLPEDYRCHGPDIVALSFFATPPDMNDGAPARDPQILAALAPGAKEPADPALAALWWAMRHEHPRLERMEDCLGCSYAAILLTREEYDGPLCAAPWVTSNAYRDTLRRPDWLSGIDRGEVYFSHEGREIARRPFLESPEFNLAIRTVPRACDPNAGLAPQEYWATEKSGYLAEWIEVDGVQVPQHHAWKEGHATVHIGGTMYPTQNIPEGFSPFYIEFDEGFGGYNFGMDGNAQLDFKNMKFDWACR